MADTVLVAGSLHYDIIVETDHLPAIDETGVGTRWYPKFGGKGGNQAVAASQQGAPTRMLGAVGNDTFGAYLRGALVAAAVDDRFVRDTDVGTGMSVATMLPNGDYAATIVSGANLTISAQDVTQDALWSDVAVLVLQNEMPEAANIAAAGEARRRNIRTVLNAAPYRALSPQFAALIDILVVNAVEAEMMGMGKVNDLATAGEAARRLAVRFANVIVTAGSQGLAAFGANGEQIAIPAEKVVVVSSHGAGDAFIGALAASLVTGQNLKTACGKASTAAARHVSQTR